MLYFIAGECSRPTGHYYLYAAIKYTKPSAPREIEILYMKPIEKPSIISIYSFKILSSNYYPCFRCLRTNRVQGIAAQRTKSRRQKSEGHLLQCHVVSSQ